MYRLLFLNGKLKGKRLTIQQGSVTIGRDPECQVDLDDDDEVSRHHAVIEYRGGSPVIRDLGATNPVEVNQQPIKEHRLRNGDLIEIGRTVIEFQSSDSSEPPRQRRRFSKMQAFSFLAIALIILLQLVFVIFFPLWQKSETVQIVLPEEKKEEPVILPPAAEKQPEPVVAAATPPTPPPVAERTAPPEPPKVEVPKPAEPVVAEKRDDPVPELPGEVRPVSGRDLVDSANPLENQARMMLAEAKSEIARMNYPQADSILERIQFMTPEFVPAWQERARLFERRGFYRQAGEQWQKVMSLTAGTPLHEQAAVERRHVARLEALQPVKIEPPAPKDETRISEPLARNIRIVSVDRERFQATEEFDDMRLVRITLRPRNNEGAVDSSQIQVIVNFYDRVEGTDILVPSRALTQQDGTRITGPWPAGESRNVTAAYILKKGFRAEERKLLNERRVYEGYRVTIYYQGVLQDENAMPRRILDLPRPPHPGIR